MFDNQFVFGASKVGSLKNITGSFDCPCVKADLVRYCKSSVISRKKRFLLIKRS